MLGHDRVVRWPVAVQHDLYEDAPLAPSRVNCAIAPKICIAELQEPRTSLMLRKRPKSIVDSRFLLAERVAIWSFGPSGAVRLWGFHWSLPYRPHCPAAAWLPWLLLTGPRPALAARHRHHATAPRAATCAGGRAAWCAMPASPTDPDKDAALIVDGATGKVLYARNETARASSRLADQDDDPVSAVRCAEGGQDHHADADAGQLSRLACRSRPSWRLRPGQTIAVDTAIRAIVIRCANDVAVVIAEALGGTESHFAEMMTAQGPPARHEGNQFPQCLGPARSAADHHRHRTWRCWPGTWPMTIPQYFPYFGAVGLQLQRRLVSHP